ncbi:hypothetical protein FQZ97_759020 [compost metagenome]
MPHVRHRQSHPALSHRHGVAQRRVRLLGRRDRPARGAAGQPRAHPLPAGTHHRRHGRDGLHAGARQRRDHRAHGPEPAHGRRGLSLSPADQARRRPGHQRAAPAHRTGCGRHGPDRFLAAAAPALDRGHQLMDAGPVGSGGEPLAAACGPVHRPAAGRRQGLGRDAVGLPARAGRRAPVQHPEPRAAPAAR